MIEPPVGISYWTLECMECANVCALEADRLSIICMFESAKTRTGKMAGKMAGETYVPLCLCVMILETQCCLVPPSNSVKRMFASFEHQCGIVLM